MTGQRGFTANAFFYLCCIACIDSGKHQAVILYACVIALSLKLVERARFDLEEAKNSKIRTYYVRKCMARQGNPSDLEFPTSHEQDPKQMPAAYECRHVR